MSQDSPIKAYFWQLSKAVVSFVTVVLISNTLGADGRGQLSLYLLYLQVVLMINEIFAGSAMSNWFSQYGFQQLIARLSKISLLILTIAAVLAEYFIPAKTTIWITLWLLGLGLTWQNMVINYFQAHQLIGLRNRWQFSFELMKFLFIILIFLINYLIFFDVIQFDFLFTFDIVQWFLLISAASSWIWGYQAFFKLRRLGAWNQSQEIQAEKLSLREHSSQGFFAQMGHLVLFFIYKTPLLILSHGTFKSLSEVGVLTNVLLIADTVWIFGNSFGMVLHSKALNNPNPQRQNKWAVLYSTISFWVTLLLVLLIFVVPGDVYTWVFGRDFSTMKERLVLITPGILALAVSAPLGHLLHARNRFLTLLANHSIAWATMLMVSVLFFYDQMECVSLRPFWLLIGLDIALVLVLFLNLYSLQLTKYFLDRFQVNSLITLRLLKKVTRL